MIIREHKHAANGICKHCGARGSQATCIPRHVPDPPRPLPPRFDADLSIIGERLRELMAEEDAARSGADTMEHNQCP